MMEYIWLLFGDHIIVLTVKLSIQLPVILYGDRNNNPLIPLFRPKKWPVPLYVFKLCNSIKFQKTRKQIKMTRKHSFFDACCCIRIVSDTLKERQYNIKLNLILRQHQIWLYKSELMSTKLNTSKNFEVPNWLLHK